MEQLSKFGLTQFHVHHCMQTFRILTLGSKSSWTLFILEAPGCVQTSKGKLFCSMTPLLINSVTTSTLLSTTAMFQRKEKASQT